VPPAANERDWLLRQLRGLIERGGAEPFVAAPLVVADSTYLPDRWTPDADGVLRLVRRLVDHVGLAQVRVVIRDLRRRSGGAGEVGGRILTESQISLAEVDETSATFELYAIGNDDLAGIASHEVGRLLATLSGDADAGSPYRSTTRRDIADPAIGSIAAVYAGLGILAANASFARRERSELGPNVIFTERAVTAAGGLGLDAVAYLLAVQMVLRGGEDPAHRALLPDQRKAFEAARAEVEDRDQLIHALGLPPADSWPSRRALVLHPAAGSRGAIEGVSDEERQQFNRGRWIFRVRSRKTRRTFAVALLAGIPLAILGASLAGAAGMAIGLAAALAGGIASKRIGGPRFTCSDRECERIIPVDAERCPFCGGSVGGEISDANDRLDAEETLVARRGLPPAA
jgi:hypothetical protein